jgi:ribose transport system permease protein
MSIAASTDEAGPGRTTRGAGWAFRFPARYRVICGAIALLLLASVLTAPEALNGSSLRIETPLIAVLAIASLGQLLVVMMGGFDLSVAAVMSFASALVLQISRSSDDRLLLAVAVALAAAVAIGIVNGLLAGPAGLNPLIVTLAMGGVVSAAALLVTDDGVSVLSSEIPPAAIDFATRYAGTVSVLLFVALALVVLVAFVLRMTPLGRRFLAAGSNPTAARIVGIRVWRHQVASYAVAGLLYGIAGVLLAAFVERPNLNLGAPYLLSTFIVVALGGALFTGGPASAASAAGGALFLVLLVHYLAIKGLSAGAQSLIQGLVLVVAVAIVTALSRRGGRRDPLRSRRRLPSLVTDPSRRSRP